MLIECKLHREGGTKVQLNGKEYHFAPQPDGSHVAEVTDEDHIAQLLAIPEGYKIHGLKKAEQPAKKSASTEDVVLLGSSEHPASFEINGKTYQLGEVVALAHTASGLSAKEWNELSEDARADLIDEELDKLAADKNGDGKVDGAEEMAALREQYKAKFGQAPHHAMKADSIRKKLAE